jgi:hypothetical protein
MPRQLLPTITSNPDGSVTISPADAWWCADCGRLRVLDEWDRCETCAATARAEARRIVEIAFDSSKARPDQEP